MRSFSYNNFMSTPLVIAHRGDSFRALENSFEAFRLALLLPADMIEFDIRKSRDNRLYVMHDNETGRTAGRNIDIEQSSSAEIAGIKLKNGEPVPSLDEVLSLVAGRAGLNIELKSVGSGALCATLLAECGYTGSVLISSFKEREVLEALRVLPHARVSGIFDRFDHTDVGAYKSKGYRFISLRKKTVTRRLVALCHENNISVYVWTIDKEGEMKKFIEWGVDGIYSNRPDVLKNLLDRDRGDRHAE